MASPRSKQHLAYGIAFRAARERLGLSQEELALEADIDRTYLGGVERGERNPSLTNLLKLAHALGVPLSEIARTAEARRGR